jgi:hypothetical protein
MAPPLPAKATAALKFMRTRWDCANCWCAFLLSLWVVLQREPRRAVTLKVFTYIEPVSSRSVPQAAHRIASHIHCTAIHHPEKKSHSSRSNEGRCMSRRICDSHIMMPYILHLICLNLRAAQTPCSTRPDISERASTALLLLGNLLARYLKPFQVETSFISKKQKVFK